MILYQHGVAVRERRCQVWGDCRGRAIHYMKRGPERLWACKDCASLPLRDRWVEEYSVLYVEDDPFIISAGRRWLRHFGWEVTAARDEEEALRLLRDHDAHPRFDVVLTDWNPCGPHVINHPTRPPAIIYSGHLEPETLQQKCGVIVPIFIKPVDWGQLTVALKNEIV